MEHNTNFFNRLFTYAAFLAAFSLPLYKPAQIYVFAIMILSWFLEGGFKEKFLLLKKLPYPLLLSALYILYCISLLYSENREAGLFDIQVKTPFLIFPWVLLTANNHFKSKSTHFLLAFIGGNLIASIFCLANAYQNSWMVVGNEFLFNPKTRNESLISSFISGCNRFMYSDFSIFHHPGYFALYINVAAASLLFLFRKNKDKLNSIYKTFSLLLLAFFGIMVYLLFSRSGFIGFAIVLTVFFVFWSKEYRKIKFLLIASVISLAAVFLHIKNPRFQTIFKSFNNKELTNATDSLVYSGERVFLWNVTLGAIQSSPVIGVGTGDVKDKLIEEYLHTHAAIAIENRLNSHNQFLETWLGIGILGVIILLAVFIVPFYLSLKKRQLLLMTFLILQFIFMLFESSFNTQAGVMFFAMFYTFLAKMEFEL